jgi:hypothetical protein
MPPKLLLAALLLSTPMVAEIVEFKDVEYRDKNIESGKVKDRDGRLYLDRDSGVFVFLSENEVWLTILGTRITAATYDDKNNRTLVLMYHDARERQREASFKLKGGNRENIVNVVNSETQNKLVRVQPKK